MGRGAGPQRSCLQVSLSETCPFCWMSCKELATVTLAYRYYKSLQGSTLPQSHCLQSHAFHRMGLLLRTHHTIHRCAAPVVLPAFVRRNTNVRQIIPCINGRRRRVSILLVTKSGSSPTRFLKSGSYIKKSLRLNSAQFPHLPTPSTVFLRSLQDNVARPVPPHSAGQREHGGMGSATACSCAFHLRSGLQLGAPVHGP